MNQPVISQEQKRLYHEEGYMVLESVIPGDMLQMLRDECGRYMSAIHREMDQQGVDVLGLNHRGRRYFIHSKYKDSPRLARFIFSDLLAEVCRATLGDEAYLFLDQYVVKMAEIGMKFSWHQDSGYIDHEVVPPYISCWCALDDVNEENGTIYILPYSKAGTRERIPHVIDKETNDRVGYHGDEPGIPVIVPAGSIAVFSSTTFHRSGPNLSNAMRRALLLQYSAKPILEPDSSPRRWAEPFLQNGEVVYGIAGANA